MVAPAEFYQAIYGSSGRTPLVMSTPTYKRATQNGSRGHSTTRIQKKGHNQRHGRKLEIRTRDVRRNSPQPSRPDGKQCQKIMKDTLARCSSIANATKFASMDSFFLHGPQIDRVDQDTCPQLTLKPIRFISEDTFTVTRKLMEENKNYLHSTAVLNMASDEMVGGSRGLPTGFSQEGALCMSSTLYSTLQDQHKHYPWRNTIPTTSNNIACIYSPDVVIFKDSATNQYKDLPGNKRRVVGVISLAAPKAPRGITFPTRLRNEIRHKVRALCRLAIADRKSVLVLGALGCGEYRCPPHEVAEEMKAVLMHEKEFKGWFEEIVFAIYDKGTCGIFRHVFESGVMQGVQGVQGGR